MTEIAAFNEAGQPVDPESEDVAYGEYTDEDGIRNYFVKGPAPVVAPDPDVPAPE